MSVTVFDGVGKFSSDTSQLDQFIIKLEQGLTTASEKAAASTQALKAAQDEFRSSIAAVTAAGGDTIENMQRLAQAEENLALAAAAAKQEHVALKEELIGTKEATSVASQAADELGSHFAKMFGIIAAAEGFKALIEHTQESVLNLQLLSEKTGIAIDTLAGVQHVAEASGVSFDEVSSALTRLSRAQALAIEGGKSQVTAFERIGISATELKTLSPEQLFYRVADAMANSSSHAAAAASAFALLGRGGAALIPIFQQNGDALKGMVDEAAKASGVTTDAAKAALDWQTQTANLSESLRAGLIPVMQILVPIIKVVEELGSDTAMALRDLGAAVGGLAVSIFDSFKGLGTLINDALSGDWQKLALDAKTIGGEIKHDFLGIGDQFKDNFQHTAESIKQIWTSAKPLKPAEDDLSDLNNKASNAGLMKSLEARIAAEKTVGEAEIALRQQQNRALLSADQDNYSAELKLSAQAAQEKYDLEKKNLNDRLELAISEGDKGRAQATSLIAQLDALELNHQASQLKAHTDFMVKLHQIMSEPIPLINTVPPGMETITNAVTEGFDQAAKAAQSLGIRLKSDLDTALQSAYTNYDRLLQLQKQGIVTQKDADNGYRALVQEELNYAKATVASAAAIQKLQHELNQLDGVKKRDATSTKQYTQELRKDLQDGANAWTLFSDTVGVVTEGIVTSIGSAFAALINGQESFGQAMEKAIAKMISQMAQQWAEYYAALAIADAFDAPPKAAAELAAAIALEAISGVLSALSSSSGSSKSSSSTSSGTKGPAANSPVINGQSGPTQVVNTTHFATGGLVSEPTLAWVGDSQSGDGAEEAIIPLTDQNALKRIADVLVPALLRADGSALSRGSLLSPSTVAAGSYSGEGAAGRTSGITDAQIDKLANAIKTAASGAGGNFSISIESDIPHLVKKINHATNTGRVRLLATDSIRLTKRS